MNELEYLKKLTQKLSIELHQEKIKRLDFETKFDIISENYTALVQENKELRETIVENSQVSCQINET